MSDRTIRLHRVLNAKPAVVQRAFIDPRAIVKWFPPHGFVCEVQSMDAKVGGTYHMTFTDFATGESQGFGGKFLEVSPTRIRYTDVFDGNSMPGEITMTVTFRQVDVGGDIGTEITITQENLPAKLPLEGCYVSWQQCLMQLANLVE